MKKRIVSLLLCVALMMSLAPAAVAADGPDEATAAVFTDISDSETAIAATTLRSLGILSSTTETTFSPNDLLTRAQACKIIVNAMGLSGQVAAYTRRTLFSDVSSSAWFSGYVNLACVKGIINGYGDGRFGPYDNITYGQMCTILLRMLGYSTAEVGSVWPTDYTGFCEDLGINGSLTLDPYQTLMRGQAAILVSNALKAAVSGNGRAYYETISGVSSTQSAVILDVNARSGSVEGLLKIYTQSGNNGTVSYLRQVNQVSSDFVGYTGEILLNSAGQALGFIPDSTNAEKTALTAAASDIISDKSAEYDIAAGAVVIVGDVVYSWANTGYLQANCYLGSTAFLFRDDIGDVSCVYLPVEDSAKATKQAVTSTQEAIILSTDAVNGSAEGLLMAYAVTGNAASIEYFDQTSTVSSVYEGQIGELLLNSSGKVVGFMPSAEQYEEVTVSTARISGIVDADGTVHRISGTAATIVGGAVYTWKDTGYIQMGSHSGKTARLYYGDDGAVAYVYLFTGGTSAETDVIMAETVTAASELVRKLGITGGYSITKNGAEAQSDDLAQYDVAYYDSVSRTLRASDRQFTGYIEAVYPNTAEAETITVSGNGFSVLECAWESLADYELGSKVTLLLTDDGKVAAATSDSKIVSDMVGILSSDGSTVTLLGSGLTLEGTISAKEALYGSIVRVSVYSSTINCYAYSSDKAGALDISAGTLGEYELAPVCEIFEHAGSGSYKSLVYSLSGELGEASYDFNEIIWTDSIPASSITAYRLNSAGKVDMLLLLNVTGNCYEYGQAAKYTGEDGINLGSRELAAYNSAVTVTNADNRGEGVKRLCSLYDAKTGVYLGVSAGTYNASYQRVVAMTVLNVGEDARSSDFFLRDDVWYVTANEAEIRISDRVQVYIEAMDQWLSGEEGLKTVLAMGQSLTVYYDRTVTTGAQIRVIVAEA